MERPSNNEFMKWFENDSNASKLRLALRTYPDLVNVEDSVSLILVK